LTSSSEPQYGQPTRSLRSGARRSSAPPQLGQPSRSAATFGSWPGYVRRARCGMPIARRHAARHLADDAAHGGGVLLGDAERHALELERLVDLDLLIRRQVGGGGLLEGQEEAAHRLGQPAPFAVGERGVPLVPDAAGGVLELRSADQLEGDVPELALHADVERRQRLDEVGDLAERLQAAVAAADKALAMGTYGDEGGADLEGQQRAARGAVGLLTHDTPRGSSRTVTDDAPRARVSSASQRQRGRARQQWRLKVATPDSG
jgi:hypothetical protein